MENDERPLTPLIVLPIIEIRMARAPTSLDSRIIFTPPIYEWISRVDKINEELAALKLTEERQASLRQAVEVDWVRSLMQLSGSLIARNDLERVLSSGEETREGNVELRRTLAAVRLVTDVVEAKGRAAQLNPDLVRRLHGLLDPAGAALRSEAAAASLDLACGWFEAASFIELHPVEQAGIVLLRLLEIQPFERQNEGTALLTASLFTLRAGLQPIIIGPDLSPRFSAALKEGLRISTRPVVELIAEAVESTLRMLRRLASQR